MRLEWLVCIAHFDSWFVNGHLRGIVFAHAIEKARSAEEPGLRASSNDHEMSGASITLLSCSITKSNCGVCDVLRRKLADDLIPVAWRIERIEISGESKIEENRLLTPALSSVEEERESTKLRVRASGGGSRGVC